MAVVLVGCQLIYTMYGSCNTLDLANPSALLPHADTERHKFLSLENSRHDFALRSSIVMTDNLRAGNKDGRKNSHVEVGGRCATVSDYRRNRRERKKSSSSFYSLERGN